jgi:phage-related protein
VKFSRFVYVLNAFQKKSKVGSKTPQEVLEKIKSRLRIAEKDYAERKRQESKANK